jgi:chorismate mutase
MPPAPSSLEDIRREIDRIDDEIAALVEARFAAVEKVRLAKAASPGGTPFRPFREAAIIGRLIRTRGPHVPGALLVRLWRVIMSSATQRQHALRVHVPQSLLADAVSRDMIRDHFGPLTLMAAADEAAALAALAGKAGDLCVVATGAGWSRHLTQGLAVSASLPMTKVGAPPLLVIAADGSAEAGPGLSVVINPTDARAADWSLVAADGATIAAFGDAHVPQGRCVGRIPLPIRIEE